MNRRYLPRLAVCLVVLALAACGGGGGGGSPTPTPVPVTTYTVSGQVQGSVSATVNLTGTTSAVGTTDASGNFSFGGLANGTYSVTPTQSGLVFAPVVATVTVSGVNSTLAAFVASTAADALPDATVAAIDAAPESPLSLSAMLNADGSNVGDYLVSRGIVLPTTPSQLMSATQRQFAKAVSSSPSTAPSAVTLPAATGPAQRKQDVIDVMVGVATFLACGRATPPCDTWNFPADASSPSTYPAQSGLAYVYGGKTPNVRTLPTDGCPQYLYGVDASGLIDVLALSVGMTVVPGPASGQANLSNWTIPADWGLKLTTVTDTSQQFLGDIVVWNNYIGIVTTAPSVVNVISSTGKAGQCASNAKPPSGPRSVSFANLGLGQPTAILRLQPIATLSTPSVVLSANPPSLFAGGGTVQLVASVSALSGSPSTAAAPTGTMVFVDQSGTAICSAVALKSGSAPCAAAITVVPDKLTAKYSGDGNYAAGTATVTVTAYGTFATNTAVVADPTGVPPTGGSVSFTATITSSSAPAGAPAPTGTVKFVDGTGSILCVGTPVATGVATCNSDLSSAPNTVTATYSGDVTYLLSTGAATVAEQPYGTTTTLTATPAILQSAGESVTFTANVASVTASAAVSPTGTVTFYDQSGAVLCSDRPLTGGSAACTADIASAPDTARADYQTGDTNFTDSSGSVTVTAPQSYATVTALTANPASIPPSGATVAFIATVTSPTSPTGGPALDGTVTFSNQAGAILCQSVPLNLGSAPCSSPIASAPNTVTASYTPGTLNYLSSSGSATVTAIAAGTCNPPAGATTCAVTLYGVPDQMHTGFGSPIFGTTTTVETTNGTTTTQVQSVPFGASIWNNVNGPPATTAPCNFGESGCPPLTAHSFEMCAVDGKWNPISYHSVVSALETNQLTANCSGTVTITNAEDDQITGYTLAADGTLNAIDESKANVVVSCVSPIFGGTETNTSSIHDDDVNSISIHLKDGSGNASVNYNRSFLATDSLNANRDINSTTTVTGNVSWPAESSLPPQLLNTGITVSTISVPAGHALPQACLVGGTP
jgi:hypothetical protein